MISYVSCFINKITLFLIFLQCMADLDVDLFFQIKFQKNVDPQT